MESDSNYGLCDRCRQTNHDGPLLAVCNSSDVGNKRYGEFISGAYAVASLAPTKVKFWQGVIVAGL